MHIVTKDVTELTQIEYNACRRANFGDGGWMRDELTNARNHRRGYEDSKAVMMWSDENHDSGIKLMAWALLTPTKADSYNFCFTPWQKRACRYGAEFWVKSRYRRKGYGTMLLKHIKRYYEPRPIVIPHDNKSGELFSKFNVRLDRANGGECWLKPKPKVA